MNTRTQHLCTWGGPLFIIIYMLGWIPLTGLLPVPSPALDATEITALFHANTGALRLGALLCMFAVGFTIPWVAVIAVQMRRIENETPVLSAVQLVGGTVTVMILMTPPMAWTLAAFRPERSPELILLVSDMSWLMLIMTFPPFMMQFLAIGLAILGDSNEKPVFDRWVGYFNIWVAIIAVPGGLVTFFKSGPFAWNGLLAFWLPIVAFIAWFAVMFVALRAAIKQQGE